MSILAASAVLTLLAGAPGQQPAPVPDIVVTGTREESARRYVDIMAEVNRPDEPLARFDRQVCPGVVNMETHARAVIDRIAATALLAGLTVGGPGCSPNVLVIFTADGDRAAADLRRLAPHVFDGVASTRRSGRTQLRRFLESDAPVRWWQSTTEEPAIASIELGTINRGVADGPRPAYRATGPVRTRPASLLSSASRMEIGLAIVIVDMGRIDAVDVDGIADYAALVALGQIDPEVQAEGLDTVMNLFAPAQHRVNRLSAFDRAYLRALYNSHGDAARASQQKSEIAAAMIRDGYDEAAGDQ